MQRIPSRGIGGFTRQTWRRIALAGIVAGVTTLTILAPRLTPKIFGYLEERTRDLQIATLTPAESQGNIILVSVREESLKAEPYLLPVDRRLLADLVTHIDAAGARAIGLDFVFDRPTDPAKDAALSYSIRTALAPIVLGWTGAGAAGFERGFVADHRTGSLSQLAGVDTTVRFQLPRRDASFSFPGAIAQALGGTAPREAIRIAWRGRPDSRTGAFADFPAHTALALPAMFFKDKIVLIGEELPFSESFATPFSIRTFVEPTASMPRLVLHAHELNQLLEGRQLRLLGLFGELVLALAVALAGVAFAAVILRPWTKIIAGLVFILSLWAIPFLVFNTTGVFIPAVMPTLGFLAALGFATAYLAGHERDQRAMIRHAFSRYVPPAVVARLDRDPSKLELDGERRELTLLFTDLADFTPMIERMDPHMIVDFMNEYLDGIAGVVLDHGGTVDKFLGDGVMSFFGAPEARPDDASRAIACALVIDDFAKSFVARWQERGIVVGETRMGIHTGPATVGNFGGRGRFHYTALGDTVNTASRIEGANKALGTRILVSADTAARATGAKLRPIGDVLLKGREQPLMLYEALTANDLGEWLFDFESLYQKLAAGGAPLAEFESYIHSFPNDTVARLHHARLASGERGTRIELLEK
jgi:class 3 adenylate cyclase/CHASE2 domain-containing sensor protein